MTKLKQVTSDIVMFKCPGCNDIHQINVGSQHTKWTWNNSLDRPTFSPSILAKTGHFIPERNGEKDCWCDYNKKHPDDADFECYLCHSFVLEGKIQFLQDCSHGLAGQTVDLLNWED